jgi:predicted  nucleic acid-binding Zn-ribbon protein
MRPTELLLQYQRLGDRVMTLTDEERHIQQRLARDERVEAATAAVAAALAERDQLARELREMDLDVEGHRAKMKSHEKELMSGRIRSPSDLTKMSEEVGHMKARLVEEEDREFELMSSLDAAEAELASARQELADAQAAVEAAVPKLQGRVRVIEGEVAELELQREAVWAEVPAPLQGAYRKISRIANPVVAMVNGQCEGCRVQLTANELQVLRRGERFTCQNCNRILVLN